MFKKIISLTLCFFLLGGCSFSNLLSRNSIPKGNEGAAKTSDSSKSRVIGDMEGDIELPEYLLLDEAGKPYPPMKLRIDGVDAELPAGTKGKFKLSASGKTDMFSLTEISSTWKINSAPVQLFVFGGIMVSVAAILVFLGMWTIGLPLGVAGFTLIGCGIMINNYPWVILIVIGVGLAGAAYYIYTERKKRSLIGTNSDKDYVLQQLTKAMSGLPDEVLEEYIKKPLRESENNSLIRKVTMDARLKHK